ncbi:MAG: iron ABC transporter permease [Candidatus Limiplasma sp.]|nr:iron ABC transporter permease [Candidatus Limiplasma sp.]MDY4062174.1 iron ABC transporter permease [Candidatus Limiplasma sp.]
MQTKTQAPVETASFSRRKRCLNWLKNAFTNPYNLLVIVSIVALSVLVVWPLLQMVLTTFQLAPSEARRVKGTPGDWTLYYWQRILNSSVSANMLYRPLLNSLLIASCVSVGSILVGGLIAWLMVRSDLPGKKFFSLAVIIPYMIPSWCKSMAWISVFKTPRIGGSAGFLSYLGITVPEWLAYGPVAIICVLIIHYYAYAYLLMSAALRSINSELEEMGEIIGAPRRMMLSKITFPLVLPSILSSFILIFSKSMGTFGVPAFLGMKVSYYTISTMLYSSIKQQQTAVAYTISLILISIAAIVIFLNQRALGTRKSYATIGGKGGRSNVLSLKKGKVPITVLLACFLGFAVVLPIGILILQSLMLKLGDFSLSNLTLHYWIGQGVKEIFNSEPGVLVNPQFYQVLKNSLKLVVIASFIATIFGQLIGYVNSRGRHLKSGKLVEQLVFIPYLIPSIAFGAMYLSMFSTAKTVTLFGHTLTVLPSLYGTFALLVLVTVVKNLPFSSRAGTANMLQISVELEEAAHISGAHFLTRFRKIVFPLSKNGFMSGFMLIFMAIMKELDLLVILISPTTQTMPYMAYSYMSGGMEQYSNVVAILMFLVVFLIYWIANKFFNADISQGF